MKLSSIMNTPRLGIFIQPTSWERSTDQLRVTSQEEYIHLYTYN